VLKIDLLPRHFAVARKNKALLALFAVLLMVAAAAWLFQAKSLAAQIDKVKADTEALQPTLQLVDKLTQDTQAKQAELAPIKAKVDFANEANKSGRGFWKAFHAINDYIWENVQVSNFSITPPGSVAFTATVRGTVGAGRFLMNLLRCPAITSIRMNGLPAGQGIAGAGGEGVPAGAGMPGAPGPFMGPAVPFSGSAATDLRPPEDMQATPYPPMGLGGPYPGSPGVGPSTPGVTPGVPGPTTAGQAPPGSPEEQLVFNVTAQLTPDYVITIPQPPGGATVGGVGAPGATPAPAPGPGGSGPSAGPSAPAAGEGGDEGA